MNTRRAPRPLQPPRGIAAVELAFVLLLLSTLIFGMIELGRALYHYNTLVKSVRAAARYLVVTAPVSPIAGSLEVNSWILSAKCLAVYGRPENNSGLSCSSSKPLLPGLALSQVEVLEPVNHAAMRNIPTGQGTINLVSVSIRGYQFNSVVSFVVKSHIFGRITAVMAHE